jgi:hypothetical protein
MFDTVNEMARDHDQFRLQSFDGSNLLIVGSFDLCYYHDVEIIFYDVSSIRCEAFFWSPEFRDAGATEDGRRTEIVSDDKVFEIVATSVEVVVGKVFHYDRGELLQPGERIAPWVARTKS